MKVLSIHQPWATLLVSGAKKIETRTWQTSHRGLLAIQAAQKFAPAAKYLCGEEPFKSALAAAGFTDWTQLPTGAIIGSVHVDDCKHSEELEVPWPESAFGDFRPGRWLWLVSQPSRLAKPVITRGNRGLFEVKDVVATEPA